MAVQTSWDNRAQPVLVGLIVVYSLAMLSWILSVHRIPLYFVETDLVGSYIPAARDLYHGHLDASLYRFHGIGYPLLLAVTGPLSGGDFFLAARLLNVLAASVSLLVAFHIVQRSFGTWVAAFTTGGMALNPTFLRATIEAGTDLPALAAALGATYLVVWGRTRATILAAGVLAGVAITIRYNMAFLCMAAVVILGFRRGGAGGLLPYCLGACLPLGGWGVFSALTLGSPFASKNYLNIAYAFLGNGVVWDQFWQESAPHFESVLDVLRYDLTGFVMTLGHNVATRWMRDIHELIPLWLGVLCVLGLILRCRGRPRWGGMLFHAGLCYLILAFVFYGARFGLYLLPFYLAGAGALIFGGQDLIKHSGTTGGMVDRRLKLGLRAASAAILLGASGITAVQSATVLLQASPEEVEIAGGFLHRLGPAGAKVMARKPHVSYFAGMVFVSAPRCASAIEVLVRARRERVEYLYISDTEARMRPELGCFVDSAFTAPGLHRLLWGRGTSGVRFAVFRIVDQGSDQRELEWAMAEGARRYADERPLDAQAQIYAAQELLSMRAFKSALVYLARAEKLTPGDPDIAALESNAYHAMMDFDAAAEACKRAMALGPVRPEQYEQLARIRFLQGRPKEARDLARSAIAMEPASALHWYTLGLAEYDLGEFEASESAARRCLSLAPKLWEARELGVRALIGAGRRNEATKMIRDAEDRGWTLPGRLVAIRDSLGTLDRRR